MPRFRAAILAALTLAGPAAAQVTPVDPEEEVTLRGPAGFEATGRFISYDGRYFRIESPGGELTLDGDVVTCEGPPCPPKGDWVPLLRLSGERAMGEVLMPALIEAFAARRGLRATRESEGDGRVDYLLTLAGQEAARFELRLSTSAGGISALIDKRTDLAMSMRPPNEGERTRGLGAGLGDLTSPDRVRIVALDALAPVVAPENPVRRLTFDEIADAVAGEVGDWFDLGGDPGPLALRLPEPSLGLGERIEARFDPAEEALRLGGGGEVADAVSADPLAFGIASWSAARGGRAVVPRTMGGCGIAAPLTDESVRRGDHPYAFALLLIGPERRQSDLMRAFLDFVLSDAAQAVVRRAGFVDRRPRSVPMSEMGARLTAAALGAEGTTGLAALQSALRELGEADRLSVTLRGTPEGSARAREAVHRLARAIEAGKHDGRELIFAGFGQRGPAARRAARAALEAVEARLTPAARRRVVLRAEGWPDVMPILCDGDPGASRLSSRVELWRR